MDDFREKIVKAIEEEERYSGERFWRFVIQRAKESDVILSQILRKLIPDAKPVSGESDERLLNFAKMVQRVISSEEKSIVIDVPNVAEERKELLPVGIKTPNLQELQIIE